MDVIKASTGSKMLFGKMIYEYESKVERREYDGAGGITRNRKCLSLDSTEYEEQ